MTDSISNRIFTSAILSTVLLIGLFFHKYLWLILLIISSIICFFEFNNLVKKIWKKKKSFIYGANAISSLYLIFFTYSAFEIYKQGLNLIIFLLLICIFSDIGGYVIGKTVGGKKLTKISPNKTISGTIGSFIFSFIPIIIFLFIYKLTKSNEFQIYKNEFSSMLYVCLLISLICQLGDLFISFFKRKAKIKNTGSFLPGHGGLLDRIDGIVFAIPSFFIINKIFF
jgi:phosphatidate cytidylyltransferase